MNKKDLQGRYLDIKQSKGFKTKKIDLEALKNRIKENDSKTIFVKNIPYDITEDEIGDIFAECGKIDSVRFVYNSVTNKFKGFAYIDF